MQVLILGGNGQLGRHLVTVFAEAGHAVTCLARGTQPAPEAARFVQADRNQPAALHEVEDRVWDAVVDLATQPGYVRRAVQELGYPQAVDT